MQFFHAEAEMYRWMEQFELKHVEFHCTVNFFKRIAHDWTELATSSTLPGFSAYASKHAAMFTDLANDTDFHFKQVGHPDFVNLPETTRLADAVGVWRTKWLQWMVPMVSSLIYSLAQHLVMFLAAL